MSRYEKLRELIQVAIGQASMCWSETPKGAFDSRRAAAISDQLAQTVILDIARTKDRTGNYRRQIRQLQSAILREKARRLQLQIRIESEKDPDTRRLLREVG